MKVYLAEYGLYMEDADETKVYATYESAHLQALEWQTKYKIVDENSDYWVAVIEHEVLD